MRFWKTVHWFATPKCNEKCKFCFKPSFKYTDSPKVVQKLAEELVQNKVKKVIFTGGEPLLLKNLEIGLRILKEAGIDISLHTNATLLTPKRTKDLTSLVNEIAIPIDSLNRKTQEYLRKKDCLPKVKQVFQQLQDLEVRIGIHTVATSLNIDCIPKIYNFLTKKRFNYWRTYEFNPDLVGDRFKNIARFKEIENLRGHPATTSDGGTNCLYADFLLIEEQMSKHKDKRVQFVGVSDYDREPYFFLDTGGNINFCTWFLQGQRKYIGNVLEEGFKTVKKRAIEAYEQGPLFDEEAFINSINDQPLWVRTAWEGNYFPEELDDLDEKHYEKFEHLTKLYLKRLIKQEAAPKDAELAITIY